MTVALDVLGHAVRVDCDDPGAERVLRDVLADLLASPEAGLADESERIDFLGPVSAAALTELLEALDSAVIRVGTGHLMPRATALARPDGSVAILCGEADSGTSTVAAALLRRGCAYLSDHTTVLDPDTLEVLPVRRPLSLVGAARARYAAARPSWVGPDDDWLVPSGALAPVAVPAEPLEPRLLVFVEHAPGSTGREVVEVSGGEAAYLVGRRSAGLGDVAGGALPVLARLARRVPAYRLRYDDDVRAAEEVLRLWSTA